MMTGTALVAGASRRLEGVRDFIFNTKTDIICDVNKIYEHGFTEQINSTTSLLSAIDSLERQKILP